MTKKQRIDTNKIEEIVLTLLEERVVIRRKELAELIEEKILDNEKIDQNIPVNFKNVPAWLTNLIDKAVENKDKFSETAFI